MRTVHVLLALLVAAVWGVNFVVIRIGLDSFPPLLFTALRFIFAALPLVFFVRRPPMPLALLIAIGMTLGAVQFGLLFVSMSVGLSPGLASLVMQAQAFFTLLLAWALLGERPSPMQIAGILVAFAGIGLIALTVGGDVTALGLSLAIGGALAWAAANLMVRKAGRVDMLALMAHMSLVPPVPLLALSFLVEGWQADLSALAGFTLEGLLALLYIALAATVFGFAVWGMLIRTYGAGRIAPFSLLVPVFGMSASALVFGEAFGPLRIAAAALVILGLVLTLVRRRAPAPLPSPA